MPPLKRLVLEIHRRSLWQVLLVYFGASYAILEAVDLFIDRLGLPEWVFQSALVLLFIGLPVVMVTALVQAGGSAQTRPDPTLLAADEAGGGLAASARLRGLFTWRNAISGGVLAFALWGAIAASWLVLGAPGLFIVRAEAADFFSAQDRVVVADFENATEQAVLGLAIREAIVTDLDQSEYVNAVAGAELNDVLSRMRLPDTAKVDEGMAVEIAQREGYPAVVSGSVTPMGAGYQLTARIIEASSGEVAVRLRETANDETEVVAAVEKLSHLVRRHLGESLPAVRRSKPLPSVTTASLAALELYAEGRAYGRRGDDASALPLLEQAVGLDTAFAAAYRALSVAYGNLGNMAAGQTNADKAYRHAERLVDNERLLTGALYHSYRDRWDSVAYYYQLVIDRDPENSAAVNNLGDAYGRMGRHEEALTLYRRIVEADSTNAVGYVNLAIGASTLGRHAVAESAVVVMRERFPGAFYTLMADFLYAQSSDDFERAEAVAGELAANASPFYGTWGQWFLAAVAAMHGQVDRALALADSSMELAVEAGATLTQYLALQTVELTALAAGAPERSLPYLVRTLEQAAEDPSPTSKNIALGLVAQGHAFAGELTEARSTLAAMDSLAEAEDFHPSGFGEEVRAAIALQEGRAEESLEHLRRARSADYGVLFRGGRLLLGDAYAALGQLAEAAAQYDTLTSSYSLHFYDTGNYGPLKPLAHERAAAVYLALGDTASAIKHLAAFAELWKDADAELQPRVEAARRAIEALSPDR